MSKVDVKLRSKKHNHKKAHESNSSRQRKLIRDMKRGIHN